MFAFITADLNGSYADSISSLISYENSTSPQKRDFEIFTDFISIGQLNNFVYNSADFVNELFKTQEMFDNRQFSLMDFANSLFKNSRPLNSFEESALEEAFKNSLIDKPTLKGRR